MCDSLRFERNQRAIAFILHILHSHEVPHLPKLSEAASLAGYRCVLVSNWMENVEVSNNFLGKVFNELCGLFKRQTVLSKSCDRFRYFSKNEASGFSPECTPPSAEGFSAFRIDSV